MSTPMPLTVYGPVTPISPFVRVTGVLPSAEVTILDNGNPIGHGIANNPGELSVKLNVQPQVGHSINAIQKTSGGTSEPSQQSIPVVDVPDPLPIPEILSALNTCMIDIWADGLVPGAQVITSIGGQSFGSSVASRTSTWLGIDSTKPIPIGSTADIHQEAHTGTSTKIGKSVTSPPIPAFQINTDLLPPPVLDLLVQCDTSRKFLQTVAGAGTTITNEGQWEFWINPSETFSGEGAAPLKKGTAVASQEMPRCKRKGTPVTLSVAPAITPPAPTVTHDICPQNLRLTVSNLAPGGILHVTRKVQLDKAGTRFSQTAVGDLGISSAIQPVDLPPDIALTDPAGEVFISFTQERCAGVSPETLVKVAPVVGPFGAPKIVEPLFACGRGIPYKGAHHGSSLQAIDASSGIPMSNLVDVTQTDDIIWPWFPLTTGNKILLRQKGCNADGDSPVAQVKPLPQPVLPPKIVEPVRPQAPWIKVTNIVSGARLYLLVNSQLRPGSFYVYTDTGVVMVTGAPLADKDRVFIIQKICDQSSNLEGPGVTVKRGNMKVSVSPSQVARGATTQVTVTAVDADTGTPITANVLLNGTIVGTTGVPFAYSPKPGDPNPAGTLNDGAAYYSANFTINLIDPAWTLALHAGPIPQYLGTLQINITQITWKVTPDWNTALVKSVPVTPTPPTAIGSVALPIPPGSAKTVTVEISGNASTPGGNLNGYIIPAQNFAIGTDTKKVAFHGVNELIAWLLNVQYVADPNTGIITFNVIPIFQGITP